MKIAYIVLKGMPIGGGIERVTEEIGSRLVLKGYEVIVYTMKHYGARDGIYRGMRVKTIPTLKSKSLEKIIASFIATLFQCIEKDVDIVHFHAFGPAMFSLIPRLLNRKVVVQGHGIEWKRSRWGVGGRLFLRLTEIPSVKFPNVITVVSLVQKRYLLRKYKKQTIYIPNGVNLPHLEKPDLIKKYGLKGNDYILFAARLVKEKGAHYLIEAYKQIKTELKLVIAGDAEHEKSYKAKLYKLAQGNQNIIFTGFVTGKLIYELFSNCYMFVLPSEIEGLPIVLLESMSYGNCCLVSDIPENLEALNNLGYAFINKDVHDLRNRMEFLIKNKKAIESKKEYVRDYILKKYSWDNITDEFVKLYENLNKL